MQKECNIVLNELMEKRSALAISPKDIGQISFGNSLFHFGFIIFINISVRNYVSALQKDLYIKDKFCEGRRKTKIVQFANNRILMIGIQFTLLKITKDLIIENKKMKE